MSRRPIGDVAMSVAERSRRKREKAKALRDAGPPADVNRSEPISIPSPVADASPLQPREGDHMRLGHDYPRMLYHPDGRTVIADTPEHHDRLTPEGWVIAPLDVHRQRPLSHHGFLGADTLFAFPMRRW